MTLHIAPGLALPDDLVTQPCAILARRGAGKTYTASVMTEELLRAGLPVVALDPLGVWWGLRSSADGTGPGLPVTILGGEHGDAPLDPTNGKVVAELVVDSPGGWIIDLSLFESQAAQDRFAYDFADRLYRAQRRESTPVHLMVDEAHNFAPQNVRTGRGDGGIGPKMLGAFEVLVRQGRARGVGCTLISQRPAAVNKNVLSQVEVLIAGQVTGTIDRKVLEEWAKGWATKAQLDEFAGSLASLKVGEAWLWSPQWLEAFERIRVRKRTTFDSSATPKAGQVRIEPQVLADVDLDVVKERLAATIEKADAEDPRKLQARIRDLEREAAQRPTAEPVVQYVEVPVVPDGTAEAIEHAREMLEAERSNLATALADAAALFGLVTRSNLDSIDELLSGAERAGAAETTTARSPTPPAPARPTPPAAPPTGDVKIGKGEAKVLAVLAQYPDGRTHNELAFIAGYSAKASTLGNVVAKLRAGGLVEPGQPIRLTDAGVVAAGGARPPLRGQALLDDWLTHPRIGEGERRVLLALIDAYPDELTHDELCARTDYSPIASTCGNVVSKLRKLGIVEKGRRRVPDEFMAAIR